MIEIGLLGEHDFIKVQYIVIIRTSFRDLLLQRAEHFKLRGFFTLGPYLGYFDLFPRDILILV